MPSKKIILLPEQEDTMLTNLEVKTTSTQEFQECPELSFPYMLNAVETLGPHLQDGKACYTRLWLPDGARFSDRNFALSRLNGEEISHLPAIDFQPEVIEALRSFKHSVDLLQINFAIYESNQGTEVFLVLNRAFRNTEIAEAGHSALPIETKTEVLRLPSELSRILLSDVDLLANLEKHLTSDSGEILSRNILQSEARAEQIDKTLISTFSISLLQRGYNNRINPQKIINALFLSAGFEIDNLPSDVQDIYYEITDLIASKHQDGFERNGVRFVQHELEILFLVDSDGYETPVIVTPEGEVYLYLLSDWNRDSFVASEAEELVNLLRIQEFDILNESLRGQGGGLSGVTKSKERTLRATLRGNGNFASARLVVGNMIVILNAIGTQDKTFTDLENALLEEIGRTQELDAQETVSTANYTFPQTESNVSQTVPYEASTPTGEPPQVWISPQTTQPPSILPAAIAINATRPPMVTAVQVTSLTQEAIAQNSDVTTYSINTPPGPQLPKGPLQKALSYTVLRASSNISISQFAQEAATRTATSSRANVQNRVATENGQAYEANSSLAESTNSESNTTSTVNTTVASSSQKASSSVTRASSNINSTVTTSQLRKQSNVSATTDTIVPAAKVVKSQTPMSVTSETVSTNNHQMKQLHTASEEKPFHSRRIRMNPVARVGKRKSFSAPRQRRATSQSVRTQFPPTSRTPMVLFRGKSHSKPNDRELSIYADPIFSKLLGLGLTPLQATSLLNRVEVSSDGTIEITEPISDLSQLGLETVGERIVISQSNGNITPKQMAY